MKKILLLLLFVSVLFLTSLNAQDFVLPGNPYRSSYIIPILNDTSECFYFYDINGYPDSIQQKLNGVNFNYIGYDHDVNGKLTAYRSYDDSGVLDSKKWFTYSPTQYLEYTSYPPFTSPYTTVTGKNYTLSGGIPITTQFTYNGALGDKWINQTWHNYSKNEINYEITEDNTFRRVGTYGVIFGLNYSVITLDEANYGSNGPDGSFHGNYRTTNYYDDTLSVFTRWEYFSTDLSAWVLQGEEFKTYDVEGKIIRDSTINEVTEVRHYFYQEESNLRKAPDFSLLAASITPVNNVDIEINVFPNPSSGSFTITGMNKGIKTINIFNSSGQLVFNKDSRDETLKMELTSGLYIIQVVQDSKIKSKTVVIQ